MSRPDFRCIYQNGACGARAIVLINHPHEAMYGACLVHITPIVGEHLARAPRVNITLRNAQTWHTPRVRHG
jgi:hypothetical protein